ncbi:MAG: HU family DNA-binding protein [Bacteroidales bacterium]|jgi:DNA-binding protein HU-beta|nr:HU family DNA-binding protein [Bacteroidales bacterium]
MNKSELINAMAEKAGLTKVQAKNALDAFMGATGETLKKGGKLSLVGFGTFEVKQRAKRKGHNPRTNKAITIPAKKVVKFKPGAGLKF